MSRGEKVLKKLFAVLSIVLLLVTAGCGNTTEKASQSSQKQEMKEITIGLMPDVDSLPFIMAQEKGYFAEEGIKVNIQQFKSAMDRDSALQSGNLDGAVSDLLAVAFAKSGGFDVRVTSFTEGSYRLVAGKEMSVNSIRDLTGKDVAVSKNTIIEYVTDQILEAEHMPADSINKVVIPQIPTRLEMLQNGKLAAATLPEPMASIAIHNGCKYVTGSDALNINPGVIMFTSRALENKKTEIQAMYRAYNKAAAYLNNTDSKGYMPIILDKGGFPPAAKDALKLPTYREAGLPKEQDVNDCMAWLVKKELIKQTYSYKDIVVDLFGK